jgi:hypothetical protein
MYVDPGSVGGRGVSKIGFFSHLFFVVGLLLEIHF